MGNQDDTLDNKTSNVLKFEVINGGKSDTVLDKSCAESLRQIDEVKEQITSGRLTSMILFAITTDGEYTRMVLSKNRFELIGLANEVHALVQEDIVYRSNQD